MKLTQAAALFLYSAAATQEQDTKLFTMRRRNPDFLQLCNESEVDHHSAGDHKYTETVYKNIFPMFFDETHNK